MLDGGAELRSGASRISVPPSYPLRPATGTSTVTKNFRDERKEKAGERAVPARGTELMFS